MGIVRIDEGVGVFAASRAVVPFVECAVAVARAVAVRFVAPRLVEVNGRDGDGVGLVADSVSKWMNVVCLSNAERICPGKSQRGQSDVFETEH